MTSTDDARAETWDQYVPTDLVNKVVNRLMRGGRDDLILANEVNTLLGASARRRAAAARAETTTATTEDAARVMRDEWMQYGPEVTWLHMARALDAHGLLATARPTREAECPDCGSTWAIPATPTLDGKPVNLCGGCHRVSLATAWTEAQP